MQRVGKIATLVQCLDRVQNRFGISTDDQLDAEEVAENTPDPVPPKAEAAPQDPLRFEKDRGADGN